MSKKDNVVVVGFAETSKAYEALSVLKQCDEDGRVELRSAAVVERKPDGELSVLESADNFALLGTASGSMIGMLIGVLGGPVGVLLGWGAGALTGELYDVGRSEVSAEALVELGRAIPIGSTALIANVKEPTIEVVDDEMSKLGGEVTRRSVSEVMAELEAAEDAAEAAASEARRVVREQKKAELNADLDARVSKLKQKLHAA